MKLSLNHNHFTAAIATASALLTAFVIGAGADLTVAELVSTRLINATIPLLMGLGFLYFLRGTKYDVLKDIFEEHNVAAAIFLAAVFYVLCSPFGK